MSLGQNEQTNTNVYTMNTNNNITNNNKKEKINKKEYGEFKNVLLTDKEYEYIKEIFPKDYISRIQTLDDYIQSKGKKYKDFVATLKNWARRDGYKFPNEQLERKEINITTEEYYKQGEGKKYE